MPGHELRRAEGDPRRTDGGTSPSGAYRVDDGAIVADFAALRETIRRLDDRHDPEELVDAVEPMER